jgi:uncharacterized membrane protein YfcA
MLLLGLLLIALAAGAVVAAVFATDSSELTYLGFDVSALGLFLIGAGSVLALVVGAWLAKAGARRDLRRRRETRRQAKASAEQARAEESRDAGDGQ